MRARVLPFRSMRSQPAPSPLCIIACTIVDRLIALGVFLLVIATCWGCGHGLYLAFHFLARHSH